MGDKIRKDIGIFKHKISENNRSKASYSTPAKGFLVVLSVGIF